MQIEITPEYLGSQGLSTNFPRRFWEKIQKTEGCWKWTATTTWRYGVIGTGSKNGMKFIRAHRASWILHNGPIPPGLCVLHKCDNPPCTNPDHLFLGTQADNIADAMNKGHLPKLPFTDCQILQIRAQLLVPGIRTAFLAQKYGVPKEQIYRIKRKRFDNIEALIDLIGWA